MLRPLLPDEAPLLQAAINASRDELRRWMPWATSEPEPVAETRAYLDRALAEFQSGKDFAYPILNTDETEVLGSSGLHPRCGAGCIEIGYWIRSDVTGRGYATEAARALTRIGLGLEGIDRIIISCDPENEASRRIPERLGYARVEHREADRVGPDGEPRDTLVFELRDVERLR